jgi:hypothetical protein
MTTETQQAPMNFLATLKNSNNNNNNSAHRGTTTAQTTTTTTGGAERNAHGTFYGFCLCSLFLIFSLRFPRIGRVFLSRSRECRKEARARVDFFTLRALNVISLSLSLSLTKNINRRAANGASDHGDHAARV